MGRSSEDDGEIVEIWKNSPIADECVGKDWVNIWNDKKTPNAGENVIVMRCHSHYAALHAHVALARYTSSPKISRLWASSHGWFRPACAPLVETRKFQFNEEVIYMKKSISRIIGVIMLIVAIVFIMFALNHPEKSFPWNNTITWLLYGVYFLVAVVLLIAPKIKKWEIPVWWSDKFQFVELNPKSIRAQRR